MKIARCVALALCAWMPATAMGAVTTTVVDIATRGVTLRVLHLKPEAPVANIVAYVGGNGILAIGNDGSIAASAGCDALGRNRQAFAERGYGVVMVDAPSDAGGGVSQEYRLGPQQVTDGAAVVQYLRQQSDVPIWIAGGSSSTNTVANLAINLPSTLPLGTIFFGAIETGIDVGPIRRPTQIVQHVNDRIQIAQGLLAALTSAPVKELTVLNGGANTGCGNHNFNGIDAQFIAAVSGFIAKYNGTLASGPAPVALAVEFHNAALDHYFLTHIANEIALLDAGVAIKGWARTGQSFNVYPAAQSGSSPVCRFYIPPGKGDSHFYGRGSVECTATGLANPSFVNEDPQFFHVVLPVVGVCAAGTRVVYRVFSNRIDANHRYMVERTLRDQMVALGWLAEGDGPDLAVMCAPQ